MQNGHGVIVQTGGQASHDEGRACGDRGERGRVVVKVGETKGQMGRVRCTTRKTREEGEGVFCTELISL